MHDARAVAVALGSAVRSGAGWLARCPVLTHGRGRGDVHPSLSLLQGEAGRLLVRCHGGCDQERVIAALRWRGLWEENGHRRLTRPAPRVAAIYRPDREDAKRTEAALAIWKSAKPADGTLAKTYLVSRGLHIPPPPTLRFHPGLQHPSGGIWPAMVALVTRGGDDMPLAIHRTFLARDGAGKAPAEPRRMMLGPCRGGAVRLAAPGNVLMVGEGLESCLAAMQASGHPAWPALSTAGLRALDLPGDVREVIVLADGDEPGEAAARDCAWRWKREGRRVRIARPPQGIDFNDMLMGRAPHMEHGAR